MLRRWRTTTSRRRAKRLKFKQQPMTPSSSPVRDLEVSDQEKGSPESTATPEQHHHPQRPETDEEPHRENRPAEQASIHSQVTQAVAELEGLSLEIDNFTRGEGKVTEATSDEETGAERPAATEDDPEDGSQTSSDESWASFPSSSYSSASTDDSSSSTDEQQQEEECAPGAVDSDGGPLLSPETTFRFYKFHEEFKEFEVDEHEDEDYEEDDDPRLSPTGPLASSAVPRWAFLRSSNSLPVLNLGPGDFYHGGSALRHEVSADEHEDGDEDGEDDNKSRRSQEIATVDVVNS